MLISHVIILPDQVAPPDEDSLETHQQLLQVSDFLHPSNLFPRLFSEFGGHPRDPLTGGSRLDDPAVDGASSLVGFDLYMDPLFAAPASSSGPLNRAIVGDEEDDLLADDEPSSPKLKRRKTVAEDDRRSLQVADDQQQRSVNIAEAGKEAKEEAEDEREVIILSDSDEEEEEEPPRAPGNTPPRPPLVETGKEAPGELGSSGRTKGQAGEAGQVGVVSGGAVVSRDEEEGEQGDDHYQQEVIVISSDDEEEQAVILPSADEDEDRGIMSDSFDEEEQEAIATPSDDVDDEEPRPPGNAPCPPPLPEEEETRGGGVGVVVPRPPGNDQTGQEEEEDVFENYHLHLETVQRSRVMDPEAKENARKCIIRAKKNPEPISGWKKSVKKSAAAASSSSVRGMSADMPRTEDEDEGGAVASSSDKNRVLPVTLRDLRAMKLAGAVYAFAPLVARAVTTSENRKNAGKRNQGAVAVRRTNGKKNHTNEAEEDKEEGIGMVNVKVRKRQRGEDEDDGEDGPVLSEDGGEIEEEFSSLLGEELAGAELLGEVELDDREEEVELDGEEVAQELQEDLGADFSALPDEEVVQEHDEMGLEEGVQELGGRKGPLARRATRGWTKTTGPSTTEQDWEQAFTQFKKTNIRTWGQLKGLGYALAHPWVFAEYLEALKTLTHLFPGLLLKTEQAVEARVAPEGQGQRGAKPAAKTNNSSLTIDGVSYEVPAGTKTKKVWRKKAKKMITQVVVSYKVASKEGGKNTYRSQNTFSSDRHQFSVRQTVQAAQNWYKDNVDQQGTILKKPANDNNVAQDDRIPEITQNKGAASPVTGAAEETGGVEEDQMEMVPEQGEDSTPAQQKAPSTLFLLSLSRLSHVPVPVRPGKRESVLPHFVFRPVRVFIRADSADKNSSTPEVEQQCCSTSGVLEEFLSTPEQVGQHSSFFHNNSTEKASANQPRRSVEDRPPSASASAHKNFCPVEKTRYYSVHLDDLPLLRYYRNYWDQHSSNDSDFHIPVEEINSETASTRGTSTSSGGPRQLLRSRCYGRIIPDVVSDTFKKYADQLDAGFCVECCRNVVCGEGGRGNAARREFLRCVDHGELAKGKFERVLLLLKKNLEEQEGQHRAGVITNPNPTKQAPPRPGARATGSALLPLLVLML